MSDLTRLPNRLEAAHGTCLAIVECSRGDRCKFAYDPHLEGFELKRLLPAGMSFPLDFGFVPSTKAEDGDPLDIMVINDVPLPMGAITLVRLIGVIEAQQTENGVTVRNDRLIGVSVTSLIFGKTRELDDLPADFLDTLRTFWTQYEKLRGVGFEILGVRDAAMALEAVHRTATARTR